MDRAQLDQSGMIKERVITVLKHSRLKMPQLEELTGISRYTWSNLKNPAKSREIKADEIEAIVKLYPQFALWIVSGNVHPECGQISPEYEAAHSNLPSQNAG